VIGITSRPETIDSGLRRAGRFEREVTLGVPNEEARIEILQILTRGMRLEPDFPFKDLVKYTPGYVGADIQTLCKEASIMAVERAIKSTEQNIENEEQQEEDKESKEEKLDSNEEDKESS
jgi:ribosome biogenesis ATPase